MQNLPYEKELANTFSYECFRTKTRFDTEAKGILDMDNCDS